MNNILCSQNEGIGTIIVSRPEAMNALNLQTIDELEAAAAEMGANDEIKVIVITGAGEKSFVAGADISEMVGMSVAQSRKWSEKGQSVSRLIEQLEKPVIAAVNGYALGGGCELAMCCDIRVASDKAKFGQPEAGLGVIPGFGGTQRLPRLVGPAAAKELIFTCNMIDAQEALRIGLVNRVVPHAELMETVYSIAKRIMKNSLNAVGLAKAAINGHFAGEESGFQLEANLWALCFAHPDRETGMNAFLKKEKPDFNR